MTPRLYIAQRLLRVDRHGHFSVGIKCPASTSSGLCRGSVRVLAGRSRLIAGRSFSIRANRIVNVRMTLNRAGRALMRRKHRVHVDVRLQTRGRDGVVRHKTARRTLVRSP